MVERSFVRIVFLALVEGPARTTLPLLSVWVFRFQELRAAAAVW